MSLPDAWVERIFEKLTVTYGHHFLGRWSGMDLRPVKADWARELSRLQQSPQAIAYAMENLPPDQPPTVLQFRELANRSLRADRLALPAPDLPPANPEMLAKVIAVARRHAEQQSTSLAQECVDNLRRIEAGCQKLTGGQRWVLECCERHVRGWSPAVIAADFTPPPESALPPSMRKAGAATTEEAAA